MTTRTSALVCTYRNLLARIVLQRRLRKLDFRQQSWEFWMPEPITLTILALLKVLGGKAAVAKMALIVKGLAVTTHGQSTLILAKGALVAVKSYGFTQGVLMVAQMLIILGSAAAGLVAAEYARKCLQATKDGDFPLAVQLATRALREAGPVWRVWSPA